MFCSGTSHQSRKGTCRCYKAYGLENCRSTGNEFNVKRDPYGRWNEKCHARVAIDTHQTGGRVQSARSGQSCFEEARQPHNYENENQYCDNCEEILIQIVLTPILQKGVWKSWTSKSHMSVEVLGVHTKGSSCGSLMNIEQFC